MFEIRFSPEAFDHLVAIRAFDRRRITSEIRAQLRQEPAVETRNRKPLRPNNLAAWELRIDTFRVFCDVVNDEAVVNVVAIGYKVGSRLFVQGEPYEL